MEASDSKAAGGAGQGGGRCRGREGDMQTTIPSALQMAIKPVACVCMGGGGGGGWPCQISD